MYKGESKKPHSFNSSTLSFECSAICLVNTGLFVFIADLETSATNSSIVVDSLVESYEKIPFAKGVAPEEPNRPFETTKTLAPASWPSTLYILDVIFYVIMRLSLSKPVKLWQLTPR